MNSMDIKIIQSTKPHRLRPHQRSGMDFCSYISIHEAARLRQGIPGLLHHGYDFNPRSRKASTLMPFMPLTVHQISIHEAARLRHCRAALICIIKEISIHEAARLRQQKHPKKNLISQNNLYTYYNIPTHNNYILIILNLFTINSTIFQVRISRDFHVHFLFAPNNSILKYHN